MPIQWYLDLRMDVNEVTNKSEKYKIKAVLDMTVLATKSWKLVLQILNLTLSKQ